MKWCEHNTNSPVLCSSVADTSWDEVNCMMYCVCPDIVLGLCSQLARTQSSAQLIPTHSVWFDVPKSWKIGLMKNRCVLTAPKIQLLGEAVLRKECHFTAIASSFRDPVIYFQVGPYEHIHRHKNLLAFSMSKSAQTCLWFYSITFVRATGCLRCATSLVGSNHSVRAWNLNTRALNCIQEL